MTIEAHYTGGKQPTVAIARTIDGNRVWLTDDVKVAGKREARQIAKQHNATPWNF